MDDHSRQESRAVGEGFAAQAEEEAQKQEGDPQPAPGRGCQPPSGKPG